MRKVRIITTGTPTNTKIFDAATCQKLKVVQELQFDFRAALDGVSQSSIMTQLIDGAEVTEKVEVVSFLFYPNESI